jgi:hypothetical protein
LIYFNCPYLILIRVIIELNLLVSTIELILCG